MNSALDQSRFSRFLTTLSNDGHFGSIVIISAYFSVMTASRSNADIKITGYAKKIQAGYRSEAVTRDVQNPLVVAAAILR